MNLLKRPSWHVLALFAFFAYYLLAIQDFRHFSSRDPGSVFFDPDRAFEREYSLEREVEAEAFIKSAVEAGGSGYVKASEDASICVGIATVQREGARYFRTALGSTLAGLTNEEREDIYLISFIVNVDPNEHQAYKEPWLPLLSDQVLTYNNASEHDLAMLNKYAETDPEFRRKPLFDYVYLLRTCYEMGAPYVAMLEDDVIAADGWYYRTKEAVKDLEGKRDFHNTAYLRLFYNERLLGWNSEQWMTYALWCIFFEIVLAIVLLAARRYEPPATAILTLPTVGTICLLIGPMCIGLFFAAGRLTVAGPGRGINRMNNYGCCSQAFLFPRERVPKLLEFYEMRSIGYIDVITEEYSDENDLTRWALTPSVFQHVGGKSSKSTAPSRWGRNTAENIWNFSFEQFDPEELKEQHI